MLGQYHYIIEGTDTLCIVLAIININFIRNENTNSKMFGGHKNIHTTLYYDLIMCVLFFKSKGRVFICFDTKEMGLRIEFWDCGNPV